MIKNLLELLEIAQGETENIRIAQGHYHLPDTLRGTIKQIKKEYRCLRNTQ